MVTDWAGEHRNGWVCNTVCLVPGETTIDGALVQCRLHSLREHKEGRGASEHSLE